MKFGAEVEATPLTEVVPMGEEMRQVMTTPAFGQAGGDYDHMIHYSSETEGGIEQPGSDENFVMMPDAGIDILAPANAYGTNSAIVSGQGVPQWYGSAEQGYNEVIMSESMGMTKLMVLTQEFLLFLTPEEMKILLSVVVRHSTMVWVASMTRL